MVASFSTVEYRLSLGLKRPVCTFKASVGKFCDRLLCRFLRFSSFFEVPVVVDTCVSCCIHFLRHPIVDLRKIHRRRKTHSASWAAHQLARNLQTSIDIAGLVEPYELAVNKKCQQCAVRLKRNIFIGLPLNAHKIPGRLASQNAKRIVEAFGCI